jgi:hypothetical protein
MKWKEFLKLNLKKIALTTVFLILFTYLSIAVPNQGGFEGHGFPFIFWFCNYLDTSRITSGPFACPFTSSYLSFSFIPAFLLNPIHLSIGSFLSDSTYFLSLLLDIIFWYVISCLIAFGYNKLKRKKSQNR